MTEWPSDLDAAERAKARREPMFDPPPTRESLKTRGAELYRNPLARRFNDKVKRLNTVRPETPEDVFGYRLLVVARILVEGTDDTKTRARDGCSDDDRWVDLHCFSTLATGAAMHLWSAVAWNKALGLEIPRHVVSPRVLPQPFTWHMFTHSNDDDDYLLLAILIADGGEGFTITEVGAFIDPAPRGTINVDKIFVGYGKTWPDDFDGADARVGQALQLLAFLSSPFIPKTRERMGRAARREAARKGSDLVDPEDEVSFVLLRRVAGARSERAETESEVEWKHRWLVSGHLRAQWYPSERAHHLIWIAPYMKGPEDAPLLEHVYKVAR